MRKFDRVHEGVGELGEEHRDNYKFLDASISEDVHQV